MPKSSSPKKAGAPKAKSSTRAKSGCYTCRIRRKKCDERPDELGRCETCVRLRLQCLGFGTKRPDWLRENNNVVDLREKIKNFLASQGMIKGHTRSGPPAVEQQEATLRLAADEQYHTPSESPQSNILVLDEESPRGAMSNIREQPELYPHYTSAAGSSTYEQPPVYSSPSQQLYLRSDSPYGPSHQDTLLVDPYPPYLMSHATNQVVPWNNPTRSSSFGPSYNLSVDMFDDGFDTFDGPSIPLDSSSLLPLHLTPDITEPLLHHYMTSVYRMQYQLGDLKALPEIIFSSLSEGSTARAAAILLAGIQSEKAHGRPGLRDGPSKDRYDALVHTFNSHNNVYDDKDAMAFLHVISAFLFDGGRGEWDKWMTFATVYCQFILGNRQRSLNYRDALVTCSSQENFIIKTVFWFDVLAAVTRMRPPRFQEVIDEIYNPNQSGLYDPNDLLFMDSEVSRLSMMNIMGCENRILWALSETSNLASWKQQKLNSGELSIPELVRRSVILEEALGVPTQVPSIPTGGEPDTEDKARYLTSEIFRIAAIIYLRTIISGDYPHVPEIKNAVRDCVSAFKEFKRQNHTSEVQHIVVRSTVFAVYLCGCLTEVDADLEVLERHLEDEGSVGNCNGVLGLIKRVRGQRVATQPVMWRDALRDAQMLLV